ncbi:MAG TPA: invasion associated locus B family protein [Methylomirabilota bacterium]|nr:invasion associated locus B family protein [Methylomirabilota bacterium]
MATTLKTWTAGAVAAVGLGLLATAAIAQDAAPAAPDAAPAAPAAAPAAPAAPATPPDAAGWVKLCGKDPAGTKEVCFVQRELRTDSGQFLASAGVRGVEGEARKILLVQTPVGMLIQPGMRVQVDKGKQEAAKYTICFPNACFAELPVDDAFVASLKRGNELIITTLNQAAKGVNFKLSLSGFTAAFDGPSIDTAALQRQQQQLQEELQRKAKEAQQRLIDAQNSASDEANTPQ